MTDLGAPEPASLGLAGPDYLTGWWVVIVAYNRYDLVTKAASAYLSQAPAPDRVLVVDNSDAVTRGSLAGLDVAWLSGHDEEGRNSGSAGGFALGMDYAFGHGASYVVLSDQDFVPQGRLLASLWETAVRHPAAAVSSFTVDPTTQEVMPALLAAAPDQEPNQLCLAPNGHEMAQTLGWRITPTRFDTFAEVRAYAARVGADIGRVPLACPQGLAIPREIHAAIGTFRSEFFVGWEDYEYCCRLQDRGYPLLLALDAVGHHHLSWHKSTRLGRLVVKSFDNDPRRFYFHIRNSVIVARERARGRLFTKWVLRLVYYSLAYLLFGPARLSERASAIRRGWRAGLVKHRPGAPPQPVSRIEPDGS